MVEIIKKGYYNIKVYDKKHFGFRNVIGYLKADTKPPYLMFHLGFTHFANSEMSGDYLLISYPADAELTKLPGRTVSVKSYKNGKERYIQEY